MKTTPLSMEKKSTTAPDNCGCSVAKCDCASEKAEQKSHDPFDCSQRDGKTPDVGLNDNDTAESARACKSTDL